MNSELTTSSNISSFEGSSKDEIQFSIFKKFKLAGVLQEPRGPLPPGATLAELYCFDSKYKKLEKEFYEVVTYWAHWEDIDRDLSNTRDYKSALLV